jgi:hypothetical protein
VPSISGLQLLTVGFGALIVPLAIVTRGQPGARRALWMSALAVFAVSALHLSQRERLQPSWPIELIGHHASLPLVLSILYQEYPFALADVFLKRALTLVALIDGASRVCGDGDIRIARRGATGATFRRCSFSVSALGGASYPALMRLSAWFVDARRAAATDTTCCAHGSPGDWASRTRRQRLWNRLSGHWPPLNRKCRVAGDLAADRHGRPRRGQRPITRVSADVLVPDRSAQILDHRARAAGRTSTSFGRRGMHNRWPSCWRAVLTRFESNMNATSRAFADPSIGVEANFGPFARNQSPFFVQRADDHRPSDRRRSDRAGRRYCSSRNCCDRVLRSDGDMSTLGANCPWCGVLDIEQARFEERLTVDIDTAWLHVAVIGALDSTARGERHQARDRAVQPSGPSCDPRSGRGGGRRGQRAGDCRRGQRSGLRDVGGPRPAGMGLRTSRRLFRTYGERVRFVSSRRQAGTNRGSTLRRSGRQGLEAAQDDGVAIARADVAPRGLDHREAVEQALEHDATLGPRERRAEAEVDARAEAHRLGPLAPDVEPLRVLKRKHMPLVVFVRLAFVASLRSECRGLPAETREPTRLAIA